LNEIGFWEVLTSIENCDPLELPSDQFSEEFRDFVKVTLNKKPSMRSSAAELLEHPFCKKYENVEMDYLKKWIRTVIY
jgi:serine/threonine protein kinase